MGEPLANCLVACFALSAFLSVRPVNAVPQKRTIMPSIKTSIRSVTPDIKIGDPIAIEFTIQNTGSSVH